MLPVIDFYFFSPTGGTKKAGELFCKSIARQVNYINLTLPKNNYGGSQSDVAVFAAPVYAGRIPAIAAERFSKMNGQGKKAITLVAYGVRGYDDALLELNDLVSAAGFQIVASGALIAQHSIVKEVGTGRPDSKDASAIQAFAKDVLKKKKIDIEILLKKSHKRMLNSVVISEYVLNYWIDKVSASSLANQLCESSLFDSAVMTLLIGHLIDTAKAFDLIDKMASLISSKTGVTIPFFADCFAISFAILNESTD